MLRSLVKGMVEKSKAEAAGGEPRRTASERRQRSSEKDLQTRRFVSGVGLLAFVVLVLVGVTAMVVSGSPVPFLGGVFLGLFSLFSLKVANQWERAVVLRFGKFSGLKGP